MHGLRLVSHKKETCTVKLPHILFLIEIDFLSVAHQQQTHNIHRIFITLIGSFFFFFLIRKCSNLKL